MKTYNQIRNGELQQLFEQLQNEQIRKRDLVVPSSFLSMHDGQVIVDELPKFMFDASKSWADLLSDFGIESNIDKDIIRFNPMETAHQQMSEKLKISRSFYRYLQDEHLDLLDYNVSELFDRSEKQYFIRTFTPTGDNNGGQGTLRALLSDKFKVIDHLDVLSTMLKTVKEMGIDITVGRCNLTANNMYVEVLKKDVFENADALLREYRAPDGKDRGDRGVMAGFVLRNSETGEGKYEIKPRMIVSVCSNGLTFRKDALASTHLGSQMESGIKWSAQTRDKEVELIESQTADAVRTFLSTEYMQEKIDELTASIANLEHPVKATENVCKKLRLSEEEVNDVMKYFINGGDSTNFGVVQALTFHAHQCDDADRQFDIEQQAIEIYPEIATVHDRLN